MLTLMQINSMRTPLKADGIQEVSGLILFIPITVDLVAKSKQIQFERRGLRIQVRSSLVLRVQKEYNQANRVDCKRNFRFGGGTVIDKNVSKICGIMRRLNKKL